MRKFPRQWCSRCPKKGLDYTDICICQNQGMGKLHHSSHRPNPAYPVFVNTLDWNTTILPHFSIIYCYFPARTAELSSCNRHHTTYKAKSTCICYLVLERKCANARFKTHRMIGLRFTDFRVCNFYIKK